MSTIFWDPMKFVHFFLFIICFSYSVANHATPFSLGTDTPLIFAKESITESQFQEGKLVINSVSDNLQIQVPLGFGFSQGSMFLRFNFSNAELSTAIASPLVADADFTASVGRGGAQGDTSVIIELTPNTALAQSKPVTLNLSSITMLDIEKPILVSYQLYDTGVGAIDQLFPLFSLSDAFISVNEVTQSDFTQHNDVYADFGKQFFKFERNVRDPQIFGFGDAQDNLASLGLLSFDVLLATNALSPIDSTVLTTLSDLFANVDPDEDGISIFGDFSSVQASLNANANCAGAGEVIASYSSENEINVSLNDLTAYPYFCLELLDDSTQIVRSEYYLDLNQGAERELLGRVRYNGASVDIPYMTTYEGYRQRTLFTNHTGFDIPYLFDVLYEEESGLTLQQGASGIIPANSVLKLNTQEIIELNGSSSRASARVFFDADKDDISAAVQVLAIGSEQPPITNVLQVEQR